MIVGMEYTTPQGDFLVFGPFASLPFGLHAEEMLPLVDAAGGVAVAAHPFRPGRAVQEHILSSPDCRLVEAINGRNPATANEQALALVQRRNLVALGGSDAHSLAELGKVATRLRAPVRCREDFVSALRLGLCEPHRMPTAVTSSLLERRPPPAAPYSQPPCVSEEFLPR
ncbi:hypothetical protein NY78_3012 [Desulfovibrio sp. TomC]|nr:hypothetical protein NY78_3012 [Desulfovibrio sp. TomC]